MQEFFQTLQEYSAFWVFIICTQCLDSVCRAGRTFSNKNPVVRFRKGNITLKRWGLKWKAKVLLVWSQSYVDQDGAEPSSNSVVAHNLLRLAAIMDSPSYRERAEAIFAVFASRLETLPVAVPEMLRALMLHSLPVLQVRNHRIHYFSSSSYSLCVCYYCCY